MVQAPSSPLVSVVIPSFQHAAYVGIAVESVLGQSLSDLEVIVVDDGSTDGTADVVAGIRDPRLRLVRLGENRRDHARNIGLAMASGRYVAFQNSDDEWLPEKLARQLEVLERRPEVGAVFTAVSIIDGTGSPARSTWAEGLFFAGRQQRSASEWLRAFFVANCLCITSAVVRHDLLRQLGPFRPSLVQLADLDMWIRLAAVTELHVIPEALTRMRVMGQSNLSAPTEAAAARAMLEMVDVLENYARPPIVERLPTLFPEMSVAPGTDLVVGLAAFARLAATDGELPHRLFADRILSRLIDDPISREKLMTAFGANIVKFFWQNRAAWFKSPARGSP